MLIQDINIMYMLLHFSKLLLIGMTPLRQPDRPAGHDQARAVYNS